MELNNITENWINDAYKLLMGKYIPNPDEMELKQLDNLFSDWSSSANPTTLNHLFEIVESHESKKIRDLALQSIKLHFPRDKIRIFVDFWITHPLTQFHDFIKELIENKDIPDQLLSVVFLMLNDRDSLFLSDPDFVNIDNYMNTLDPLLGSLVYRRYALLKNSGFEFQDMKRELSIIDLIRLENYQKLWENLLDYPLPFVCELLKLLNEEGWEPFDNSDKEVYGQLLELLGDQGWAAVSEVIYMIVSKHVKDEYRPLTDAELRDKDFHLILAPDVINRPDRIKNNKFISRGVRTLSNSDIGVDIFDETIRKSDVDGLLHIPFYSSNGVEIAEFAVPASGPNNFYMDDDGLYFTIKTRNQDISVDIDAVAAFLLPVNKHSAGISEIISTLLEKAGGRSKMILRGLNLLSTLHRGREFTLFDTKNEVDLKPEQLITDKCQCTLSIDVGDSTTKAYLVVNGSCDHEEDDWELPSLLYYNSPTDIIVGAEVIEKSLTNSSQTFRYFKNKLKLNLRDTLRIHSEVISAEDAFIDFITAIIEKIVSQIEFKINGLAVTYSLNMPAGFDARLRTELRTLGFSRLTVVDELTAALTKYYRIDNLRGKILFVNVGSSQISGIVAAMEGSKSRKRTRVSLMKESPLEPFNILTRISYGYGLREFYQHLSTETGLPLHDLNEIVKDSLNGFEDRLTKADLNDYLSNSNLFNSFTYIIRDLFVKSGYRGVKKEELTHIVISGKIIELPVFKNYISEIFKNQEVILDKSPFDEAIGAGLISSGQKFNFYLDQDYFCRLSNRGVTNYSIILKRGEFITPKEKYFEVNQKALFDKIVIDLWSRRPKIIEDDNVMPLKDSEYLQVRKDDGMNFVHNFLTRELLPVERKSELILRIEDGILKVGTKSKDNLTFLDTNIMLM